MSQAAYRRLEVDERRAQLLEVGTELFSTHSFEELSMARIAREAGISKALLYHYFPSKQAYFEATLQAARQTFPAGRVFAVFQPHLFSRTQDQAEGFGRALLGADMAVVTDVYPSREKPIPGVTGELVVDAAMKSGHRNVRYCPAWKDAAELLRHEVAPGDVVITLGAGDVNRLAQALALEEAAG